MTRSFAAARGCGSHHLFPEVVVVPLLRPGERSRRRRRRPNLAEVHRLPPLVTVEVVAGADEAEVREICDAAYQALKTGEEGTTFSDHVGPCRPRRYHRRPCRAIEEGQLGFGASVAVSSSLDHPPQAEAVLDEVALVDGRQAHAALCIAVLQEQGVETLLQRQRLDEEPKPLKGMAL